MPSSRDRRQSCPLSETVMLCSRDRETVMSSSRDRRQSCPPAERGMSLAETGDGHVL